MSDDSKDLLRRATPADADNLWSLRTRCILGIQTPAYAKKDLRIWAAKPQFDQYVNVIRDNFYLICERERIVGAGFLDLQNQSIEAMYVTPEMQGRGIGKLILEALLKEARSRGMEEVSLSSTVNAEQFYKAVGFQPIKKSVYKILDGLELDCIDMKIKFSKDNKG